MQKDKMPRCRRDAMLCRKIQQGDKQAAHLLCLERRGFVEKILQRFRANFAFQADREDLMQAGYLGLLKAAKSFDTERQTRFELYAYRVVWHEIDLTARQSDTRPLVTQRTAPKVMSLLHIEEKLKQHGLPAAIRLKTLLLAGKASAYYENDALPRYLAINKEPLSLDQARAEDDWLPLQDLISDRNAGNTPEKICHKAMKDHVHQILQRLKPRNRDIIRRYFGFGGRPCENYSEIARAYDLSHERIRQILNKELAILTVYFQEEGMLHYLRT